MTDAWQPVSQTPAPDPWKVVSRQPAPVSPYEPEQQFKTRMDAAFGAGKWRETSGYRDPAHNAAVGGVPGSAHTRGTPEAPGAHDIVIPGMNYATAAKKLPKDYKPLAEGNHLHITDAQPWTPVAETPAVNPWQVVSQTPVPAQSPPSFKGHPEVRPEPDPGARRRGEAVADLKRIAKGTGEDPLLTGLREAGDIAEIPLSYVGGAAEKVARAGGKAFGASRDPEYERKIGDIAESVVPIPGAEEARVGLKAVTEGAEAGARIAKAEAARAARALTHVVGDEPHPRVRAENALFRVTGGSKADQIEENKTLKALVKKYGGPKKYEALETELHHEIEKKLIDPKHEIPEHLKALEADRKPYADEQRALYVKIRNRLRKGGAKDEDIKALIGPDSTGYVPRRVAGMSPGLEAPKGDSRDPVTGGLGGRGRTLTKTSGSLKARSQLMWDDGHGKRTPVIRGDATVGDTKTIKVGGKERTLTAKPATTREVEASGALHESGPLKGKPIRYITRAVSNTIDETRRLRGVARHLDTLDLLTQQAKAEGHAFQEFWYRKNAAGELVKQFPKGGKRAPPGFVSVPNIPQLEGWKFDPKTLGNALKDFHPNPEEGLEKVLLDVNRLMIGSLYWNPLFHAGNVGANWTISRGFDWLNLPRLLSTGVEAMQQVITQGSKFQQMLREGSGMVLPDRETGNFYKILTDKAAREMTEDPRVFANISRAFKLGNVPPVQLYKAIMQASSKTLWTASNMMLMQRTLELQRKGLSAREAIREAEKIIPNMRVPSQVLGLRATSQILRSPLAMNFGRYHYDLFKAWAHMFGDLFKGDTEHRIQAIGQFLVAAGLAYGIYPLEDKIAQMATGNKHARMRRAGMLGIPDNAVRFADNFKEVRKLTGAKASDAEQFPQFMASIASPSPAIETPIEVLSNRDLFTGKNIIDPRSSRKGAISGAAEYAAGKFDPAQVALSTMKPHGGEKALAAQFGVQQPAQMKSSTAKRLRGQAKSQEKRDPLRPFIP